MTTEENVRIPLLKRSSTVSSAKFDASPTLSNLISPMRRMRALPVGVLDNGSRSDFETPRRSPFRRESQASPLKRSFGSTLQIIQERGWNSPVKLDKQRTSVIEITQVKAEWKSDSKIEKPKTQTDDYSNLIMYFPEPNHPSFEKNPKKPFSSFNELVKSTKSGQNKLLEDILEQSTSVKHTRIINPDSVDQTELVRKVLKFNQMQKKDHMKKQLLHKQELLLPLIKQTQELSRKVSRPRILPSRKLYDQGPGEAMSMHETPTQNTPAGPSLQGSRKQSKVATEEERKSLLELNQKTFEQMFESYIYRFVWEPSIQRISWKPEVREGHTLTTVGKKLVLYGGINNNLVGDVAIFDKETNTWSKCQSQGDEPLFGRHGHSACEYRKTLIIFGGEQLFNDIINVRDCLDDTRIFVPERSEWKRIFSPGSQMTARRYHTAVVQNKAMYVYGGINKEGIYIKDLWCLQLKTYVWERVLIQNDRSNGIAFHSMVACYNERFPVSVSFASKEKEKEKEKVFGRKIQEGIYVFGGRDGEGKILNTLKYFSLEEKKPQWKYPVIKGDPPAPRYGHTTLFYEPLGLLIIYGGKNEFLYGETGDVCFNDIRILNLEMMHWSHTSSYGLIPRAGRYLHAAAILDSKMWIFGGVEMKSYSNEDLKIVELNQNKTKKFIETEEDEDEISPPKRIPIPIPNKIIDSEPITPKPKLLSLKSSTHEEYAKSFVTFQPLPTGSRGNRPRPNLFGTIKEKLRSSSVPKFTHREKLSSL